MSDNEWELLDAESDNEDRTGASARVAASRLDEDYPKVKSLITLATLAFIKSQLNVPAKAETTKSESDLIGLDGMQKNTKFCENTDKITFEIPAEKACEPSVVSKPKLETPEIAQNCDVNAKDKTDATNQTIDRLDLESNVNQEKPNPKLEALEKEEKSTKSAKPQTMARKEKCFTEKGAPKEEKSGKDEKKEDIQEKANFRESKEKKREIPAVNATKVGLKQKLFDIAVENKCLEKNMNKPAQIQKTIENKKCTPEKVASKQEKYDCGAEAEIKVLHLYDNKVKKRKRPITRYEMDLEDSIIQFLLKDEIWIFVALAWIFKVVALIYSLFLFGVIILIMG